MRTDCDADPDADLPGAGHPAARASQVPPRCAQPPRYDLVITGGTVIDGTGAAGRRADVAIARRQDRRDRHDRAGRVRREVIDASGLIVAPGFIDVHTHADEIWPSSPQAENFVRMGVTSIVAGNCGVSALDVGEALAERQPRPARR